MKTLLLLVLSFLNSVLASETGAICGGKTIPHCTKCSSRDTCEMCEEKYFLIPNGLSCVACNDSTYGQIGCEGNCDGSDYSKTKFAFCEKNGCKEGYYNLNGICYQCETGSPHCSKCNYEESEDETKGKFVCQECETNKYGLTNFGTCKLCSMNNCKSCHYINNTNTECDICNEDYYKSANGECKACYWTYIPGGQCYICSDNYTNYEAGECSCFFRYTKVGHSTCMECKNGCNNCEYNQKTNDTECKRCDGGYVMNSDKNCIYCGKGCSSCNLDKENNINCSSCFSGIFLEFNKCLICDYHCSKCIINDSSPYKNESICIKCEGDYGLNQEKECISCKTISDIGGSGCYACRYNQTKVKFECLSCSNDNYVYINNTFKCLSNTDSNQIYLYGCLRAFYKEETNTFECLNCKKGFIQIINDKTCRKKNEIGISSYCNEVENLGTPESPIYSCTKCPNNTAFIKYNSNNKKECFSRSDNFNFCIEGEIEEDGNHKCTKCVELANINSSNLCECNFYSFGKYNEFCYKCDDDKVGMPGCLASRGCSYVHSNDELDCNECKEGYFKYSRNQCYKCETEIKFCNKCHFDQKVKCDNCINIYSPNDEKEICEINECQEYPEISPGCIICKDKLEQYFYKNKCQICKYGYFKTKTETCIYCSSEEYGGPACYECGYEIKNGIETNNIICKDCYSMNKYIVFLDEYYNNSYYYTNSALSPNGKCYNCKYSLSESCLECQFNFAGKLMCTLCAPGYYLDAEGKCISYIDKILKIPNCDKHKFDNSVTIYYFFDIAINNNYLYFYNTEDKMNYKKNFYDNNEVLKNIKNPIKASCLKCKEDYYLNDKGECIIFDFNNCIGRNNIVKNINICINICEKKGYPMIYVRLVNNGIDFDFEYNGTLPFELFSIYEILYDISLDNESQNIIKNIPLCYNIFSNENLSIQFEGCEKVIYLPKNKIYKCFKCKEEYIMDYEKYICHKIIDTNEKINNCETENIGTELFPINSCTKCHHENQILVNFENGIKSCVSEKTLENCVEITANSTYINPVYNCESCKFNYMSYYSKFYERKICQSITEEIMRNRTISLEMFKDEEHINANSEGICKKNYFTPDGKKCYKCDNKNIGVPGCKGECSFSLNRNNTILCESECKDGYIEVSKGICQTCDSINKGCYECNYENDYPTYYLGIRYQKRFKCNLCKEGFILSQEGKCLTCSDLKIDNCEKCSKDEETGNYFCKECSKYHAKNELGYCQKCIVTGVILNNKCIQCHDINNGGIEGCHFCDKNENNSISCKQCTNSYILFKDNNTCLERTENEEFNRFETCLELTKENDVFICSRCKPQFSLLRNEKVTKCVYISNLYDLNINSHYYYYYFYDIFKKNYSNYEEFMINDYNYKLNYFYPCKEAINLGTNENPLYSCIKCYSVFDNEDYDIYYSSFYKNYYDYHYRNTLAQYYNLDYYGNMPVRVIDNTINNISYCLRNNRDSLNCTEAIYKISKGKDNYNCTKCLKDNILIYNNDLDIYYCAYNHKVIQKCLVDYCKNCIHNNNYFCSNCLTSEYEVNKYTGSCVKKMEIIPAVSWKDIYRLNMNGQKEINGKNITGPSFNLRGVTSNQINTRHAFLIYLTFKIRYELRNLEEIPEILKIPAFCEIEEGVEENEEYASIVDYECIGNSSISENYKLIEIAEPDNDENTIFGNLIKINEIIKNSEDLIYKNSTSFTLGIMDNMVFFDINTDNNIINSSNNTFYFHLNGTINKPLNIINKKDSSIIRALNGLECLKNILFEMNKIDNKAECYFCYEENLNASLTCSLVPKEDLEEQYLSFATSEIKINGINQTIYIPKLSRINLIYKKEKEINYQSHIENTENDVGEKIETTEITKITEIVKTIEITKTTEITEKTEIITDKEETDITQIILNKPLKKKSNNNNGLIIGLSVGGGIILLSILTAILFYYSKSKKS